MEGGETEEEEVAELGTACMQVTGLPGLLPVDIHRPTGPAAC